MYTVYYFVISDFVGHMKLVNGQTITDHIVLDEADITEKRHLCVHVQSLEYVSPVLSLFRFVLLLTHMISSYVADQ